MKNIADFSELEVGIHMALDALSNGESVNVEDEWIEQAGEEFKAAIRRKLEDGKEKFRLRMSNIGRPTCQLQNEKAHSNYKYGINNDGATTLKSDFVKERNEYSFFVKMLIGDAVESIIKLAVKASGANITGSNTKVQLQVNDTIIKGENDLEIDGAIWDVKSCSPYAFDHKWSEGWNGVYHQDSFGYVSQLYGYAKAENKPMGGWIVVNKSTGEVKVVDAAPTPTQLKEIEYNIHSTEQRVTLNLPFERCFEEEDEFFKKKATGNKKVNIVCTFCPFLQHCWPTAELKPQAMSTAQDRKVVWYTKYDPTTNVRVK